MAAKHRIGTTARQKVYENITESESCAELVAFCGRDLDLKDLITNYLKTNASGRSSLFNDLLPIMRDNEVSEEIVWILAGAVDDTIAAPLLQTLDP